MHADEVDADVRLVRRLLATQFPKWAALPIERVASAGTDNALFRLGRDAMVAWKVLAGDARDNFRTALPVDEATWARGRGWALSQAVNALAYYTLETNPVLVREAQRWLAEVLADDGDH
jgi:aminoglycoside phosphotransferase (APT) family kinase protein